MESSHTSPVLVQHILPPHSFLPHLQNVPPPSNPPEHLTHSPTPPQEASIIARSGMSQTQPTSPTSPQTSVPHEQIAEPSGPIGSPEVSSDSPNLEDASMPTPSEGAPRERVPVDGSMQPVSGEESRGRPQAQPTMNVTDSGEILSSEEEPAPNASSVSNNESQVQPIPASREADNIPALPPPIIEEPKPDIPDWMKIEEDTSIPSEDELKEIEASAEDYSALDFKNHEKFFFNELDDPDQRPIKRFRLNWTVKGVRGTREKPNYARVMNSPAAYIDGLYWQIKFFPRGNNSSAVSAYVKCTKEPPPPDAGASEGTFAVFQGGPDADLGNIKPELQIKMNRRSENSADSKGGPEIMHSGPETDTAVPGASGTLEEATNLEVPEQETAPIKEDEDWRLSAQLGMILYNPEEPRTCHWSSSEHQFNKHNDDWGWTNFSGPWNEIHRRRRGQRTALLRNDTIAMDAYVQIFDDPSQALWWHPAPDVENQWDSKSLAGYFPMGTPPLYHSPGVAGLTALLLLAPFRKVLQEVDTSLWRQDSLVKPQPLICQLQLVLFLMRKMKKSETYVNVNYVLEHLERCGEVHNDAMTFWEILRRSVELELEGNESALTQIAEIFDARRDGGTRFNLSKSIKIPVVGASDIQMGLHQVFGSQERKQGFPQFLPIMLDRQKFDPDTRSWKMLYNRVKLNEEIDLAQYSIDDGPSQYTLYGFIVHVGERTSGKFYSVLRPSGPGTKWLAFEDGDGNKVFSYTKRRIQKFEGLEGEELRNNKTTHQTAYIAMYIRTSCLKEYLPGALEPYDIPDWLKSQLMVQWDGDDKTTDKIVDQSAEKTGEEAANVSIEFYSSLSVKGRLGLLDMYNLKDVKRHSDQFHNMTVPPKTMYAEVRTKLAEKLQIDQAQRIRLWTMNYSSIGEYMSARMESVDLLDAVDSEINEPQPLCLWMVVIDDEEDVKRFGEPDPTLEEIKQRKEELQDDIHFNEANTVVTLPQDVLEMPPHPDQDTRVSTAALSQESVSRDAAEETESSSTNLPDDGSTARDILSPAETEAASAAPDMEQTSVAEAVAHDIAAPASSNNNLSAGESGLPASASTEIAFETPSHDPVLVPHTQPVASETSVTSDTPPIGIQVDLPTMTESSMEVSGIDADIEAQTQALIASIIAADLTTEESGSGDDSIADPAEEGRVHRTDDRENEASTDDNGATPQQTERSDATPQTESVAEDQRAEAVRQVYGFIQLFDIEKQNFVVWGSFFAGWDADIKTAMRKRLGYDDDRQILVWQRIRGFNTALIESPTTFADTDFKDGVDIIVGDVLSDDKRDALLAEGKCVTPESLSKLLWMTERRHPVYAFTGETTLEHFGAGYYKGPMVNGRFHGDNARSITADGDAYIGSFIADQKSGYSGIMTYQSGDVYEGGWLKDKQHGQGTFVEKRSGNKYIGGFENGKRWGEGITYWKVADQQTQVCQICFFEEIDALFYDCGHVCACVECAKQCEGCPICRKPIVKVVRMFRS